MPVTINGTTGVTSPTGAFTNVTSTTGTFSGAVQASGVTTNLYPLVSSTAVASTSGTSIDFTGIPSWVKRITVMFNNVSKTGTSSPLIQLITSSGAITSGYSGSGGSAASASSYTTGFGIRATLAADVMSGVVELCLCDTGTINPNNWIAWGVLAGTATAVTYTTAGGISLGQPLTGVRITTTNGTDTFDLGSVNIMYG